MSNYVFLVPVPGTKYCVLEAVENFDDTGLLRKGRTLKPWPANVRFHMDPNFPKAIQLADCISNLPSAFVASKRLKEMIEAEHPANLEFLSISIVDHKGRVASADYFVINPSKLQDCIDKEASILDWNAIDTTLISDCEELVIDEGRIDAGVKVFRLKHLPSKIMVTRELADKIKKEKFTGVFFTEISDI